MKLLASVCVELDIHSEKTLAWKNIQILNVWNTKCFMVNKSLSLPSEDFYPTLVPS